MGKAWDARCRRWYGDRYDVRRNMVRGKRLGGAWGIAPGRGAGAHAACCVAPRLLNIQSCNTHTHQHHTTTIPRLTGTTTCGLWPMTRLAMTPQRAASSTMRTSGGARGPRHVPPYPTGAVQATACVAGSSHPASVLAPTARASPLLPHLARLRHWRLTGVAHELRDSTYEVANPTMLTTAKGRTKEFKDR